MMPKMMAKTPRNANAHQFCANRLLIALSLAGQPGVMLIRSSIVMNSSMRPGDQRNSGGAAFAVVDIFELGIDHSLAAWGGAPGVLRLALVHRFDDPQGGSRQRLHALPDTGHIIPGDCRAQ